MAVRKALVIISGAVQEMPGGDTLAGAGGGGGATILQTSLVVGVAQYGSAVVSVAVVGTSATSNVLAQLAPNDEWDADDLAEFDVVATPTTDAIAFTILRNGPIGGTFAVNYQVTP